jgi:TonB family protein
MLVGTQKRKKKNSTKVNLVVSAIFHGVILGALLYFAAREGLLGKQIKKIAVEMVKEKPKEPEKPKEAEKPKVEQPKVETPKIAATKVEPPKETPPAASVAAPAAVAPPVAALPEFDFDGGRAVISSSDPVKLYKGLVEDTLRLNWDRPKDADDHNNVAEVEVGVDKQGDISDPVWKKSSGQKKWDQSVRDAIAATPRVSRPPPKNFPDRVTVKFDVEAMQPAGE